MYIRFEQKRKNYEGHEDIFGRISRFEKGIKFEIIFISFFFQI